MSSDTSVNLSYGVRLECRPRLDQSLDLSLVYGPQALCTQNFPPKPPKPTATGTLKFYADEFVDALLNLEVNFPNGEVTVNKGHVRTFNPHTSTWCTVLQPKDPTPVLRFAPCGGLIGMRAQVGEKDMTFNHANGDLRLATPNVLRFFVDDRRRAISNIGQMVKRRLFPDYPGFVFNTVAYVGSPGAGNVGRYTDPKSPWFNIFVGYYQIDAPPGRDGAGWDRPFGYERDGVTVRKEDLVRLAKADWNWFSNWNYGTPAEEIAAYDDIEVEKVTTRQSPAVQIDKTWWHPVEMGGVEVASTYESYFPDAAKLALNSPFLTEIWRWFFGFPCPQPDEPDSFIPTNLRGQLLMAFQKDAAGYHTRIFGGTLRDADKNDKSGFLVEQMRALRNLIATVYGDLGFPNDPAPPAGLDPDVTVAARRIKEKKSRPREETAKADLTGKGGKIRDD